MDFAACNVICSSLFVVIAANSVCSNWIYDVYTLSVRKSQVGLGTPILGNKDSKKSGKKNSQLVLRLDKEERDAFVELCKDMDTSAAREIRGFIRSFMKDHGQD